MKAEGKGSKSPLADAFAHWGNLKIVIAALIGATAGQAVVWYTGQFYALFFLQQTLKIDAETANYLIAGALLIGTPFFVVFGILSDRVGRKPVILVGCILAAATYFPIFKALTKYGNPAIHRATEQSPVAVVAARGTCSFQFDPVGSAQFTSSCDIAKGILAKRGVPYKNSKPMRGRQP
jgi:MFS family permease